VEILIGAMRARDSAVVKRTSRKEVPFHGMTRRDGRVLIRVGLLRNNAGEHGADGRRYGEPRDKSNWKSESRHVAVSTLAHSLARRGEARRGEETRGGTCSFTAAIPLRAWPFALMPR